MSVQLYILNTYIVLALYYEMPREVRTEVMERASIATNSLGTMVP